jgi:macrolide-specific efflux system membrane fusion protein
MLVALGLLWQTQRGEARSEPLATQTVQRMTLEVRISALGTLQAMQAVEVGTQVSGQLERLHVQVGDLVRQQQLVAEIDPSLLQSRVAAGQAGLRQLRAQLQDLNAKAELATLQLKRNRTLLAHEAVTEDAVQTSVATQSSALAQVEALKAQIEQAQAQLAGEETSLRTTRIHAPMAGTVVAVNVRPGQTVVASQTAPVLLRIANLERMTVWAQVSEADVPAVQVGMPAEFSTLGLPERRWQGVVRQILPTPETVNNVVLYNVLFDVDNRDGALKPQMSAQVSFIRSHVDSALVVPLQALAKKPKATSAAVDGDSGAAFAASGAAPGADARSPKTAAAKPPRPGKGFVVQVLGAGGVVETRKVRIGLQTGGWGEVLAGLSEGEAVVVDDTTDKPVKKPGAARTSSAAVTGLGKLF